MQDTDIVNLYWQRDEHAIEETSQKYGTYLKKLAYQVLSDWEDSKECVNDTFLAAWNSMPEHRPQNLSTYLGKILRQTAIDRYRKKNSQKRMASSYALSLEELEDCVAAGGTPEQELDARQLAEAVNAFVRSLSEEARTVFIGRYYFFDSLKQIASYTGRKEGNVKTVLYRTRQKLKETLEKEGFWV